MKLAILASACLAAAALPGCQSTANGPVVDPTVLSTEQQAFDFVCPTLTSGALDPVAATFSGSVQQAYAAAKALCNVGAIATPGQFAADFIIIEPIIQSYLAKKHVAVRLR